MTQVRFRLRGWLAAVTVATTIAATGACSGGDGGGGPEADAGSPTPSATAAAGDPGAAPAAPGASATAPDASAAAPGTEAAGFTGGLVVASCYAEDLTAYTKLVSYDPVSGNELKSTTFSWPSQDQSSDTHSLGGCDGRPLRVGYNADFTRVYADSYDWDTGSSAVGYLDTGTGEFVRLSRTPGDFDKVAEIRPVFHLADNRVYFYDVATEPRLMSMSPDGGDVRPETGLQARYEDLLMPSSGDRVGDFAYVLNTTSPVMAVPNADGVFNDAGTLQARFGTVDGETGVVVTDGAGTETRYALDWKPADGVGSVQRILAFLDDHTLLLTDGMQIHRATLAGGTAATQVVLANTNDVNVIKSVGVSPDKKQLAFTFVRQDGFGTIDAQTDLYTLPTTGGTPRKIATFPSSGIGGGVYVMQVPAAE